MGQIGSSSGHINIDIKSIFTTKNKKVREMNDKDFYQVVGELQDNLEAFLDNLDTEVLDYDFEDEGSISFCLSHRVPASCEWEGPTWDDYSGGDPGYSELNYDESEIEDIEKQLKVAKLPYNFKLTDFSYEPDYDSYYEEEEYYGGY